MHHEPRTALVFGVARDAAERICAHSEEAGILMDELTMLARSKSLKMNLGRDPARNPLNFNALVGAFEAGLMSITRSGDGSPFRSRNSYQVADCLVQEQVRVGHRI